MPAKKTSQPAAATSTPLPPGIMEAVAQFVTNALSQQRAETMKAFESLAARIQDVEGFDHPDFADIANRVNRLEDEPRADPGAAERYRRQDALASALAFHRDGGKTDATASDVVQTADTFLTFLTGFDGPVPAEGEADEE